MTDVINEQISRWSRAEGVKVVSGDFDGDGLSDISLVGGKGWGTVPVAFSCGDGSFGVTDVKNDQISRWSQVEGVKVVSGDFDGDGLCDISLVGGKDWNSIPVAFSCGDGSFKVTDKTNDEIARRSQEEGVKVISGDFNGDGLSDICLIGGKNWTTIPIAFSNGDGSFTVTDVTNDKISRWSREEGVQAVSGDFDGDKLSDISLVGGKVWNSVPVAFSYEDGSFVVTDKLNDEISRWSKVEGAKAVSGDFNGDKLSDICLIGGKDWGSIPVAFSKRDGSFRVTDIANEQMSRWSRAEGVKVVSGDFNGDGLCDISLVGGKDWNSIPVAFSTGYTLNNWMQSLSDDLLIGDINIPGTHDAAAINKSDVHTPYDCHSSTITNQLQGGIRLLDVRLKVEKNDTSYSFVTCHGDIGSSWKLNEYQTFSSLLDECKKFLAGNPKEVVLLSLKIDDWSSYTDEKAAVLGALKTLLEEYPVTRSKAMPTLGSVRGKIFLLNRINNNLDFGVPISWSDNTAGSYAYASKKREYNVYVQDKYKGLSSYQDKCTLVKDAFGMKKDGEVVWNFASATWLKVLKLNIKDFVLSYLGENPRDKRPQKFGWVMLDYEFEKYQTNTYNKLNIVQFIVSSNFNYDYFPKTFEVYRVRDELGVWADFCNFRTLSSKVS